MKLYFERTRKKHIFYMKKKSIREKTTCMQLSFSVICAMNYTLNMKKGKNKIVYCGRTNKLSWKLSKSSSQRRKK